MWHCWCRFRCSSCGEMPTACSSMTLAIERDRKPLFKEAYQYLTKSLAVFLLQHTAHLAGKQPVPAGCTQHGRGGRDMV